MQRPPSQGRSAANRSWSSSSGRSERSSDRGAPVKAPLVYLPSYRSAGGAVGRGTRGDSTDSCISSSRPVGFLPGKSTGPLARQHSPPPARSRSGSGTRVALSTASPFDQAAHTDASRSHERANPPKGHAQTRTRPTPAPAFRRNATVSSPVAEAGGSRGVVLGGRR